MGAHFCGGISNSWPYLVEGHEKKRGTILKILSLSLKFISVYKLVAVKTFNGFFYLHFDQIIQDFDIKKSLFFFKIVSELQSSTYALRGHEQTMWTVF